MSQEHLSPLDQSLMGRTRAKNPYPDAKVVREQQLRAVKEAPLDFAPGALKGDSPATRTAQAALNTLAGGVQALSAAAKDSPMDKLAPAARRKLVEIEASLTSANATVAAQLNHYDKQIAEAISPRISDALGAELRTLLRGRPAAEIAGLAMDDPRVSAAVLSAPRALVGLKKHEIEQVRSQATQAHAKELSALRKEAQTAADKLGRAADWLTANIGAKVVSWELEGAPPQALAALNG
jgi:hypothetical protein